MLWPPSTQRESHQLTGKEQKPSKTRSRRGDSGRGTNLKRWPPRAALPGSGPARPCPAAAPRDLAWRRPSQPGDEERGPPGALLLLREHLLHERPAKAHVLLHGLSSPCVPGPGHGHRPRLHICRDAAASDSERYDDFSPPCNHPGSLTGPPHGLEMGGERHRRSGGAEP
jgi:hypothetical protein